MLHRLFNRVKRGAAHFIVATLSLLMLLSATNMAQAATPVSGPVVVRPGGAQFYDAPDGEIVATLPTSTVVIAGGRSEDAQWVVGQAPDGSSGWLRVEQIIVVGVELLPVATEIATEVEAGVPAPQAAPSTAESAPVAGDTTATAPVGVGAAPLTGTVASGDSRLNIRSGPDTTYAIAGKALPGESYGVIGRTADATWLQIDRGGGETGWVSATFLVVVGDVASLPVVSDIAPPPTPASPSASQTAAPSGAAVSDLEGTLAIQSSPGGMIYAYDLESGELWPLSHGFDPAISPDGQTVAFVRDGGENGVYLIGIDGSNERLIFSGRTRLSSPKWSPDGQWILFTRSDESYQCYELGSSCITPPAGPNGEAIRLPGVEPTTRYWYKLARIDGDGNNYRDIASLNTARAADWNEAGIVYQSDAGLQLTADAPDAENRLVIFDYLKPFYDDPDWQPQGGRIVYMGKEASHWELFGVNPDGTGKTALTRPQTTIVDELPSNVAPAWSPDGAHIVFLSNRMDSHEAGAWRVWVMKADGSNQRLLPIDLEIGYTFGGEQAVSWGP